MRYLDREEINKHCIVLIAVIMDLIRDAENIMEYLTYIQKGSMHPKLMPIDEIIAQLKEATQQLSQGLYFQGPRRGLARKAYRNNRVLRQNKYIHDITFSVNCAAYLRYY